MESNQNSSDNRDTGKHSGDASASSHEFRYKRIQRGIEYILLASMFLYYLIVFNHYYELWAILALGISVVGLNVILTMYRERRRTMGEHDLQRIKTDTFETLMLLVLVVAVSAGRLWYGTVGLTLQEYLSFSACIFGGVFIGGFVGETYWQLSIYPGLDATHKSNYLMNLKRTIVLPYMINRTRKK